MPLSETTWDATRIVVLLLPIILIGAGAVAWLFMRKTIRTRLRIQKQLRDDPDINEWLVCFNWSRKVLYLPMIAASLVAALVVALAPDASKVVGGVWLGIFFLNFLVDEYEMSVKLLFLFLLCFVVLGLWLTFLGWFGGFISLFKRVEFTLNPTAYVIIALLFVIAIAVSWFKGLFYYVAITPNYLNIQVGPTETGEQVAREEYSTRVDTGDFLERMLGFGRIVITFADQRRQPLLLLVGHIGEKAGRVEAIRGKLAIDRYQLGREGEGPDVLP